jgi:hypothetical protein
MSRPVPAAVTIFAVVGIGFATSLGDRVDNVVRWATAFTLVGTYIAYRANPEPRSVSDNHALELRWSHHRGSLGARGGRNMKLMKRTILAFLALVPLVLGAMLIADALGLSERSWGTTAMVVAAGLIATLIDREGFYGPRDPRSR